ncbi:MAG: efflux RND transporter periplasmic adaptor subunit [Desulfobacterales bacterium]|nr:MAG: efflux RND transporter periplasmic adaptor subunit [Desulfobacterales bacterium]
MRKLIFTIGVIIFMAVLTACSPPEENGLPEKKPVPVKTLMVDTQNLPVIVESVGRLVPFREVTLASEVGGVVKDYTADIGDRVNNGVVLVKIDPEDYRLALNEALANQASAKSRLDVAKKSHNRSETLLPRKVISQDSFDKSEAEFKASLAAVAQAKALVDISRQRLKKTRITAPFAGFITARHIEVGQTIALGQSVMSLSDLNSMRAIVHLAENDYIHLDNQDPVLITVPAFPDMEFKARIHRIGIKADERTNTFTAEILVENPDLLLKAGLTARVLLTVNNIPDAIMIPQSAVLYRENHKEVFVVNSDDTAAPRTIKLERSSGDFVQVLEGLAPGDKLIVTGGQYLEPGDKVKIAVTE